MNCASGNKATRARNTPETNAQEHLRRRERGGRAALRDSQTMMCMRGQYQRRRHMRASGPSPNRNRLCQRPRQISAERASPAVRGTSPAPPSPECGRCNVDPRR
eukprot:2056779-Pyramimonas_sp.AAC.1